MNSTVPLCLCHECSKDCHLPDCQLLAYVKELERDKARLDWALENCELIVLDTARSAHSRAAIDETMKGKAKP